MMPNATSSSFFQSKPGREDHEGRGARGRQEALKKLGLVHTELMWIVLGAGLVLSALGWAWERVPERRRGRKRRP